MTLKQLEYFVAVAENLSFRKAAEALYVTQPLLSRQISDLEYEAGNPLFIRNSHSIALTPAGQIMLKEANALLKQSQLLLNTVRDSSKYEETYDPIRIGYEEAFPVSKFGILLGSIKENKPALQYNISRFEPNQLKIALVNNQIDIAFTLLPDINIGKNMDYQILEHDTLSLIIAKHVLPENASLDDFINLTKTVPLCLLQKSAKGMTSISQLCQEAGIYTDYIFADNMQDMLLYALSGTAISVMPHAYLQHIDELLPNLACAQLEDYGSRICLAAIWNQNNPSAGRDYLISQLPDKTEACRTCHNNWCMIIK